MKTNLLYFSFSLFIGCAAQKPAATDTTYYEKIDVFANESAASTKTPEPTEPTVVPKVEIAKVEPRHTVNDKVNTILDSISKFERTKKFLEGYVLQVYSGQNRAEAEQVKNHLQKNFPMLSPTLQYMQPKFRVVAGGYFSRLQAQADFNKVKSLFPATMLVPEMVPVK